MSENVTKKLSVTFKTGLPNGTHATFKHDGEFWIAYPARKNARISAVIDRMIGIFNTIQREMIDLINSDPKYAERQVSILNHVGRAMQLRRDIVIEKCEAMTQ